MAEHFGHESLKVYQKGMPFASMRKTLPAILIMAHLYSRNRNRYRYRGRIPCIFVDFGPDPDLDPDSGCHN